MEGLTVKYTDYALECLFGDLEWKLVKFVEGVWDGSLPGTVGGKHTTYELHHDLCGGVLVLSCQLRGGRDGWEVSARMASEHQPQFHAVGLNSELLRNNLANGSGDPLGLLREYRARHRYGYFEGHAPITSGHERQLQRAYA